MRFNSNETSGAEGIADHESLLRLLFLSSLIFIVASFLSHFFDRLVADEGEFPGQSLNNRRCFRLRHDYLVEGNYLGKI